MSSQKPRTIATWATLIIFLLLIPLVHVMLSQSTFDAEHLSRKLIGPRFRLQFEIAKLHISDWKPSFMMSKPDRAETMEHHMKRLVRGEDRARFQELGFTCQANLYTDLCISKKPVWIENNADQVTIYVPSTIGLDTKRKIKPYARQEDENCMQYVTPLQIVEGDPRNSCFPPTCQYKHNVPAVVFSSGGFTGNIYHELNEVIIPLFLTTRHFESEVQFFVTDYKPTFIHKYRRVLRRLSRFEPIGSSQNGSSIHCFPGAIIGLMSHGNIAVNYSGVPGGYTLADFKQFLHDSFNLKTSNMETRRTIRGKPVLVFISRRKTRVFLNEEQMVRLIEDMDFQVHIASQNETSNLEKFAQVLNSCNVLVGAHGAGFANEVFLPQGAMVVQVVPLGLKWASDFYYGSLATKMGLRYLEYKIEPHESSLVEKYSLDDPVIVDPNSVFKKGYWAARALYIDGQNMTVNLTRFSETLLQVRPILDYTNT